MGNEHQKQQKIQEHQQRQAQLQQQQAAERQKQQEATKNQQMQVKSEQTVYSLNSQILNIDDLIRKKEAESQRLEARAKELITQGKKIEAKKLVGQLKNISTEITNFRTRRAVIFKQKGNLEMASIDMNMAGAMGDANKFIKDNVDIGQKMQDVLLDQREIQAQMAERNDLMNQLANNQQNAAEQDQMFKELEKEVNTQKAHKITQQLNNQPQGVRVPAQQVNAQYNQSSVSKNKSSNQMDDIQRMLNS